MRFTFIVPQTLVFSDFDYEGDGVGGSEASLVLLTRELSIKGHAVEVFSNTQVEGVFHGIRYRNFSRFDAAQEHETLVLFRCAWPPFATTKARQKVFWSTDIDWADWDETIFPHAGLVLCISPFHRDFLHDRYKRLRPETLRVLELGVVDRDYFDQPPEVLPPKPGNRLIYCSVPDRGLIHLARLFPKIKSVVRDAELVVTSDFSLWGKAPGNEQYREALAAMPGVQFLGKVPRHELVALQKSSKVMAYPCTYHEGFCIAAMECIAAGAVPVSTEDFALRTTIGRSGFLVSGRPGQPQYDDEFVSRTVELLKNDALREEVARAGRRRAYEEYRWEKITDRKGVGSCSVLYIFLRRLQAGTTNDRETLVGVSKRNPIR